MADVWRDIRSMRTAEFIPYHNLNIYFDCTEDMHAIYNAFSLIDMFDFLSEEPIHPCVHLICEQIND